MSKAVVTWDYNIGILTPVTTTCKTIHTTFLALNFLGRPVGFFFKA